MWELLSCTNVVFYFVISFETGEDKSRTRIVKLRKQAQWNDMFLTSRELDCKHRHWPLYSICDYDLKL